MKKLIILVLLAALATLGFAAVGTGYSFAYSAGTYEENTTGTVLGTATNDDHSYNALALPFTFTYNGTAYTSFSVNANGFLALGATVVSSYSAISGGTSTNVIAACNRDLQGQTGGSLSWEIKGSAPDRYALIQWKNYRKYGATGDDYNFQIKLYETSNKVEIVYGLMTNNATVATPQVGLRGVATTDFNNRTTTTNWAATTAGTLSTATCTLSSTVFPASGTTFAWTVNPLAGEPTNHATAFAAGTVNYTSIQLNWTGAVGAQLPQAYLILAKTGAGAYASVADGVPVTNDAVWTDFNAAVNVPHLIGANTYTFTGLSTLTSYDFVIYPYTNDEANINFKTDGIIPTVSATTLNPTISTFPTSFDFGTLSTDTFPPQNWSKYSGVLADPTVLGAAGTGSWLQDDWKNVTTPANKAGRINIYGTFNGWLVSPPISIPAAGYEVMFDVAYMAYGNNNAPGTTGTDDQFAVLIGDGTSWAPANVVRQWDNAGSPYALNNIPPAGMTVSLPFGAAGTYRVAFYGISTVSNADNDLMVDNITFRQTPANAIFSLTPSVSSWDFGQIVVNTAATKQFTITNTGGGTLNLSSVVATGTYYSISVAPTDVALTAGESTNFTVQYLPTAAGAAHPGTLTITDGRAVTTVTLSGSCADPTIYVGSLPSTHNFDAVTAPAWPLGWRKVGVNGTTNTQTTTPYSAPNCVYMYTSSASVLPTVGLPTVNMASATNLRMRFYARANYTVGDELRIGYLTDPSDAATFTLIEAKTMTALTYTPFTVNLGSVTGIKYFAIQTGTLMYSMLFDDVVIEAIPTTPVLGYAPASIGFGSTQANTPTAYQNVTVTNNGGGTLNLTAANISLTGTDPGQFGFTTTTGFPAALTAGQSVTIPVRFAPTTMGSKTATLRIAYNAVNYDVALTGNALSATALLEGFEGTTFPPADWTVLNVDAGLQTWTRLTTGQRTGLACASIGYESAAHNDWLITPRLSISASDYTFSFWAMNSGTTYQEKFNVKLSTLTNGVADFTNVIATAVAPGAAYSLYSYDLSAFAGSNVYVGIQATETDQLRMWIDDVTGPSLYLAAGIPNPVTLVSPANAATGLAATGFDFTWTAALTGGTPTSYVVYMAADESTMFEENAWTTTNTHFNPVTEGLVTFGYLDYYYWTVKAINGDGNATVDPAWSFEIESDPTAAVTVFPYTMDFEANGDNSLPSRWTRSSLATGWEFGSALWSEYWDIPDHTVYAAANDDAAGSAGDGSMDLLFGPHFDFSGTYEGIPILTFDSFYSGAYGQIATVEISTNGVDWTVVRTLAANAAWVTLSQSLADYDGMSDVQLRFHADDAGDWASGWAIDNFSIDFVNIDLMEPVVDHYPVIGVPLLNTDIVIGAVITDDLTWNNGITSATLHYTLNGGAVVDVPMIISGAAYAALIPGQAAGTLVAYYITAVDASAQLNTLTTATWDFYIDSPVWLQYDSNTITANLGLNTGTFGIMTAFENSFGAGNPCQINSIFARSLYATTGNIHVYTYDSGTDTFTDVIPSFAQSFLAGTDTVIPLTGCVTTAGYYYVAITDVVGPNYFALDETQAYYPGTHYVMFGAGMTSADLGTVEDSGFAGSWLLRANVGGAASDLDTPVVAITDGPTLAWSAVAGANSYKVYGSADPYAVDPWTLLTTTGLLTYTNNSLGDMHFFKVVADSDAPLIRNAAVTRINNLVNNSSRHAAQAPKGTLNLKNRN